MCCGPRPFGGPALTLFYFFLNFLFPVLSRSTISALVRDPKEPIQVPRKTSLFPVSVYQRGTPKSPRSPENVRPQNFKIEAAMSGAPNGFLFPVSARDPNSAGPQRVQGRQKRSSKRKTREAQSLKSGATNKFFCSFFGQGAPKSEVKKIIYRVGQKNVRLFEMMQNQN